MKSENQVVHDPEAFNLPDQRDLRETRVVLGLTQVELGERVGVDRDTIRHWERGETSPQLNRVRELLRVFREEAADK